MVERAPRTPEDLSSPYGKELGIAIHFIERMFDQFRDEVDGRLDGVDGRLDGIDKRLGAVGEQVNQLRVEFATNKQSVAGAIRFALSRRVVPITVTLSGSIGIITAFLAKLLPKLWPPGE